MSDVTTVETKRFNGLIDLLKYMDQEGLNEGEVITNLTTGEDIIYQDGSLRYLTSGLYVSNPITLSSDVLDAEWEITLETMEEVKLEKAVRHVVDGGTVYYRDEAISSVNDLLEAIITMNYSEPFTNVTDFTLLVKEDQLSTTNKHARKTTETEAWAILFDRYLFNFSAKELAGKYNLSLRNIYYIIDGTYYEDTFKRFKEVFAKELHDDDN